MIKLEISQTLISGTERPRSTSTPPRIAQSPYEQLSRHNKTRKCLRRRARNPLSSPSPNFRDLLSLSLSLCVSSSTQFDDGPNRDQTLPFLIKKTFKEPNRTRSPALLTAHANLPRLKLTGERASTQVGLLRTYATDADGAADGPGPQCLGK